MNEPGKLAVIAATAVALSGLGGGVAMAQSVQHAAPRPAANQEPVAPDTDALQQGDQTTPDAAPAKAATAVHPAAVHHAQVRSDGPGDENNTETENENVNDGPGGHEDPPGDVQHEGGPDEP
ncbi:MAG: hypothetical protein JWN54_1624 [Mycobacterium sp.]|nr:hypothetical protein [Mycobacterium sp.]